MNNEPVAYINVEKRCLEWAKPTVWNTPTIAVMDKIPLYTQPSELQAENEALKRECDRLYRIIELNGTLK